MNAASKLATMAELLGTVAEPDCRARCAQAGLSGGFSLHLDILCSLCEKGQLWKEPELT